MFFAPMMRLVSMFTRAQAPLLAGRVSGEPMWTFRNMAAVSYATHPFVAPNCLDVSSNVRAFEPVKRRVGHFLPSIGGDDHLHEWFNAVVTQTIRPNSTGRVKANGSWWSARCGRSLVLKPGTLVNVVGRDNITLIVEPVDYDYQEA